MNRIPVLIFLIIFLDSRYITAAGNIDWCSKKLDCDMGGKKSKNTLCQYKDQNSTNKCKDIHDSSTPEKKKEILKLHNEYRNMLANGKTPQRWPKAADMRQMTWDDNLEALALRWAVQCTEGHDQCRSTPGFPYNGQNYAMERMSPKENSDITKTGFKSWVDEIKVADQALISRFHGGAWGHFTQVAWASNYKLGCSEVQYQQNDVKAVVLICNYGPGGNIENQPIYKKGDACSACPKGTKCKSSSAYPHLCAKPDDATDEQPGSTNGKLGQSTPNPKGHTGEPGKTTASLQPGKSTSPSGSQTGQPNSSRDHEHYGTAPQQPGKTYKNTVCMYKAQTSTSSCENIHDTNSPEKRKELLHLHNEYRNWFANGGKGWPKAADMREMSWDDKLEAVALRWALQCIPGHDRCRSTPDFNYNGQNYARAGGHPQSDRGSFQLWTAEIKRADKSIIDSYKGGLWGHFTQVVWAASYKLGCAQVQYNQGNIKTALVCNYGPGGNIKTHKMYEKGEPCTACPKGTKCNPRSIYPYLCAKPDDVRELGSAQSRGHPPSQPLNLLLPIPSVLVLSVGKIPS